MNRTEAIHFGMIVGESRRMQEIFELIDVASRNMMTVLIEGETGTGKELVARAIHNSGPCKNKSFVAINCTAVPKDLVESELFGHEKGAFTSAHTSRIGKFELAQNGSILLDEIGDVDQAAQAKLLRVLEEREFSRIGGNKSIKLNSKIMATTNRSLLEMVDNGRFRDDLYYRLSEFTIYLPPLRERKEDIPLLVNYFIKDGDVNDKDGGKSISKDALDKLMEYDWPGNIRELKNVVRRAKIQAKGDEITSDDITIQQRKTKKEEAWLFLPPDLTLMEVERRVIQKTIEYFHGDKKRAAKALGIAISTLYEKIKCFKPVLNSL